jgi:hypothetical protein
MCHTGLWLERRRALDTGNMADAMKLAWRIASLPARDMADLNVQMQLLVELEEPEAMPGNSLTRALLLSMVESIRALP